MKICVLASGSEGNSTFLSTGQHKILIDMGKNMKYITEKLKEIGDLTQVAPTILEYMDIAIPKEMKETESLFEK